MQKCIWDVLDAVYNADVNDDTTLKDPRPGGLGKDDMAIKTKMWDVINEAVQHKGCHLTNFGPDELVGCKTVGDVVDKVTNDILSN